MLIIHQAPILLALINVTPSMDTQYSEGWNYSTIPKLQRLPRWSLEMDCWDNFVALGNGKYIHNHAYPLSYVTITDYGVN